MKLLFYALLSRLIPRKLVAMCLVRHFGKGKYQYVHMNTLTVLTAFEELTEEDKDKICELSKPSK